MSKHTKGEWKVIPDFDKPKNYIVRADDGFIVRVNVLRDNNKANANLIASAPELLEACKMAKTQLINCALLFDMPIRFKESFNEGQKQLQQAIAKADGGKQ